MSKAGWLVMVVLLVGALLSGLVSSSDRSHAGFASVESAAPEGSGVLFTWLEASGRPVVALRHALDRLEPSIRTLIVAEPAAQEISEREVDFLRQWVTAGGTLVYLAPRLTAQPAMDRWLQLSSRKLSAPENLLSTVTHAVADLRGITHLRLSGTTAVESQHSGATAMTSDGRLWLILEGKGGVWVTRSTSLIQNNRLDVADNAQFWLNLSARGPMAFDEFHHHAQLAAGGNVLMAVVPLVALLLAFVLTVGVRFTPARTPSPTPPASSEDLVGSLAQVALRARLEGDLRQTLDIQVRRWLSQHFGLAMSLTPAACTQRLQSNPQAAAALAAFWKSARLLEAAQCFEQLKSTKPVHRSRVFSS
jgi:Domain of unknown function (DUF4350)